MGRVVLFPLALALIGTLYPYEQRGRPLGSIFGAMAGGMAFGSTLGVIAEPFIGWRGLFLSVGAAGFVLLMMLRKHASLLGEAPETKTATLDKIFVAYQVWSSLSADELRTSMFF